MEPETNRPPVAEELPAEHLLRPERGRGIAIASLVLMNLGLLASLATLVFMWFGFRSLATSGTADPEQLADAVATVLWITWGGMGVGLVGAILGMVAVFGRGNRERWFLIFGLPTAALQLVAFPLGTLAGIVLLVAFVVKRREFGAWREPPGQAGG